MKGKLAYIPLKLDMKKAYDRTEWNFIPTYLSDLGFDNTWITCFWKCIITLSYSIIVNNEICSLSHPGERIDKVTFFPLICLLCMEVLAKRLQCAAFEAKSRIGIKVCP